MSHKKNYAWMFSFPFLIVVSTIVVIPIIFTIYISFTNMNVYHWFNYRFIGLANYTKSLLAFDAGFLPALIRTIVWTVLNMFFLTVVSFLIAVGLNVNGLKLKRVYKTLLIFPWAMPAYVSILLWRMGILNPEFGLLSQIIRAMGFKQLNVLSTNISAFITCMVVNLWLGIPYMFTMMDGAIQSVDRSVYESARLDGAGFWKMHFTITWPMILPILAPILVLTAFTNFKQFDIVYLMTMQTGAKTGASIHTVITYVYDKAFVTSNYGYSSAISVLVFAIIIFLYVLFMKEMMRKSGKGEMKT